MVNRSNKLSPEELAQAESRRTLELSNAYSRLFNTPDGQVVFGDLNSRYLTNDVGPNTDHSFFNGCKSVMVYIINRQINGAN